MSIFKGAADWFLFGRVVSGALYRCSQTEMLRGKFVCVSRDVRGIGGHLHTQRQYHTHTHVHTHTHTHTEREREREREREKRELWVAGASSREG
jgi:hypothetical protein